MAKKIKRVEREFSEAEKAKHDEVRHKVMKEFPPKKNRTRQHVPKGIGIAIFEARTEQGLTWYAVAKKAGIPNSRTVREIEAGHDVKLSSLEAVAKVLGLKLEVCKVG